MTMQEGQNVRAKKPTRRPRNADLRKVVMEKAGVATYVAQACGVSVRTINRWRRNRLIEAMFQEARAAVLDLAEASLFKNIRAGKTADTIFYLKCFGKGRGYVERLEVTGADGDPLALGDSAREATDKMAELMLDPDYRRIACELVAAADRVKAGAGGGNGRDHGNGADAGGNGSGVAGGPGEVCD